LQLSAVLDLGGTGPGPKGHVHVLSYMFDMCVPLVHFYQGKFFVDAMGSIMT